MSATIYEMLILKSEDSTISVSGLNTTDTSNYFKRLASRFKSFNSGTLKRSELMITKFEAAKLKKELKASGIDYKFKRLKG